ncbi:MAG TPA: hypothetical protein VLA88_05230 [Candidatus Saccharimonadales bacterium]|nr:hypothetical protein [Candidatus Saccharimonadales bacterium]
MDTVLHDILSKEARQAFDWAAEHALPGSVWVFDGPVGSKSHVYFMVVDYETLCDPYDGCTMEIGRFQYSSGSGFPKKVTPDELPDWFRDSVGGRPSYITALSMKRFSDGCRLGTSRKHL